MNRLVTEFIGTYFLILTIAVAGVFEVAGEYTPFAVGAVLVAVIYAGGHISKAHYNPAISLAFLLRGSGFDLKGLLGYVSAQILAAIAAVGTAWFVFPPDSPPTTHEFDWFPTLVAEFLFTFLLAWVILNVAAAKALAGNQFYGIAIAAAVMAGIYTVGIVSLALFNPAVAIAMAILGKVHLSQIWIPMAGSFAGAAVAAYVCRAAEPTE